MAKCLTCNGSGQVECGICNGSGVVFEDGYQDGEVVEQVEVECTNCNGEGYETCGDCGGTGEE